VRTLVTLLEAIIDRTAEAPEKVGAGGDQVAKEILERKRRAKQKIVSTRGLDDALDTISTNHHMAIKAPKSLVSSGRVIGFLALAEQVRSDEARDHVKSLARDAASLADHATFIEVYAPSGERGGELAKKGFDLVSIVTDTGFLRAGA
jgi:magnesium transporter